MSTTVNLTIDQGTDYLRTFTVMDVHNTVMNLTSCTLSAQIKRNNTSTEYISFTVAITDALHGKVSMSLPHSITSTMEGKYMYDIFLTDPATKRFKIVDGLITITQSITRLL